MSHISVAVCVARLCVFIIRRDKIDEPSAAKFQDRRARVIRMSGGRRANSGRAYRRLLLLFRYAKIKRATHRATLCARPAGRVTSPLMHLLERQRTKSQAMETNRRLRARYSARTIIIRYRAGCVSLVSRPADSQRLVRGR